MIEAGYIALGALGVLFLGAVWLRIEFRHVRFSGRLSLEPISETSRSARDAVKRLTKERDQARQAAEATRAELERLGLQ